MSEFAGPSGPASPDPRPPGTLDKGAWTAADDALPAVTPPSAGFILQLFFIPLLIVSIILAVWLMFSWLAHLGASPERYVQDLMNPGKSSWQSAWSLATTLRDPGNEQLKSDAALARSLADVLRQQLAAARLDDHDLKLRTYVCRALGEFYVADGLPVLIQAATTERDVREVDVRRAALEAIAALGSHVDSAELAANPDLMPALERTAQEHGQQPEESERRGEIRSATAFVLGVLGTEPARALLVPLLADGYANARFNAATGLARHGDERAIGVLVEMLDPNSAGAVAGEDKPDLVAFKRQLVLVNGLAAAEQLAAQNPQADRTRLIAAVEGLQAADLPRELRVSIAPRAKEVLYRLKQ